MGWLPFHADAFDFVSCAAYKWLLSPRGTAFGVVRPERLGMLRPLYAGWYAGDDPWASIYGPPLRLAEDARRLDISPAWLAWVGTVPALELLAEVGIPAIHRHDVGLANALRERLDLPSSDSAIVTVKAGGGLDALRGRHQGLGPRRRHATIVSCAQHRGGRGRRRSSPRSLDRAFAPPRFDPPRGSLERAAVPLEVRDLGQRLALFLPRPTARAG